MLFARRYEPFGEYCASVTTSDLAGFTVAVTADRRREEQAILLERSGLEPAMFPLLRTEMDDPASARVLTERACRRPPQYLLANTGYGMRTWFGLCKEWGLLDELVAALGAGTSIAARGAKVLGELRKVGLDAFYKAPGETLGEVVDRLLEEDLTGKDVVVQLHGEKAGAALARLTGAGARVARISVYRTGIAGTWPMATGQGSPAIGGPAVALTFAIAAGGVDAVSFTAAPAVHALFAGAEGMDDGTATLRAAFNEKGVVAACIGAVCASAARELGVANPLVPEHPRLGSLASALARHLAARNLSLLGKHGPVLLSGRFADALDRRYLFTPAERRVLRTLLSRGGMASGEVLGATEAELSHLSDVLDGALTKRGGKWELALCV